MKISFDDFKKAYAVLSGVIEPTPMVYNEWLSKQYKCDIYLKLENMLPIGSFKMRGATYKISRLTEKERKQGVLAVSAGNHAQGVAWAAQKFGIKATIIMPIGSPLTKIKNTETLGAKVILYGDSIEEGFVHAQEIMKKTPMTFVHPYNDAQVIAGQGTVAFEMINQLEKMDYVFSSIGGGGLVSGMGSVLKYCKSSAKIIAGQASGCSSMVDSLKKGKIIQHKTAETFADGIKVKNVEKGIYKILNSVLESAHTVTDEKMAWAVLQLMEKARIIAEGAGALPLALFDQLYQKSPKKFIGKKIVLVICGGNIDVNLLDRIIDRGLIESKRRARVAIPISDKPGNLHRITAIIKAAEANILQVFHDRDSQGLRLDLVNAVFTLEVKGEDHLKAIMKNLKKEFPESRIL